MHANRQLQINHTYCWQANKKMYAYKKWSVLSINGSYLFLNLITLKIENFGSLVPPWTNCIQKSRNKNFMLVSLTETKSTIRIGWSAKLVLWKRDTEQKSGLDLIHFCRVQWSVTLQFLSKSTSLLFKFLALKG